MGDMERNRRSTDNDIDKINAFKQGDVTAFDSLVLKHQDSVFSLAYWYLGDYQEASDCSQDTFLKAFKSIHSFRFDSAFSTWLYRIAVNTCKNRLKSSAFRWKKKAIPLENPGDSDGDATPMEIQDNAPTPLGELESKERDMLIRKTIASLPEDHRQVIVLRDIQGLTYEEISDITGQNLGTVKSRLSRARLELKNKLMGRVTNGL